MSKIKEFFKKNPNLAQVVKFTLYSLIAFAVEFSLFYALQYGLASKYGEQEFHWFLFSYAPGKLGAYGLAGFIAFLVSKCVAEIICFIINRKKTFEANNNVVFSAIAYFVAVICIILLSTWIGGALGGVLGKSIGADWGTTIAKLMGSVLSWIIMFLLDKFVIMRKVDKTQEEAESIEQIVSDAIEAEEEDIAGEALDDAEADEPVADMPISE